MLNGQDRAVSNVNLIRSLISSRLQIKIVVLRGKVMRSYGIRKPSVGMARWSKSRIVDYENREIRGSIRVIKLVIARGN